MVNRRDMLAVSGTALAGMMMAPRFTWGGSIIPQRPGVFRAGAFAQDITPEHFPIVVNGNFKPVYAEKALDPLHARCLVLDDGRGQIAMAVVDSCVLDRELMDEAKRLASGMTGIPTERIFISATHTHSRRRRSASWAPILICVTAPGCRGRSRKASAKPWSGANRLR